MIELLATSALAAVGVIIWLVRLEGRVNGHDTTITNLDKRFDRIDAAQDKLHEKIDALTTLLFQSQLRG